MPSTVAICRNCDRPIVFAPFFLDGKQPNPSRWWHVDSGFTCPVSGVGANEEWPVAAPPAASSAGQGGTP